jgi:hypothetical protein
MKIYPDAMVQVKWWLAGGGGMKQREFEGPGMYGQADELYDALKADPRVVKLSYCRLDAGTWVYYRQPIKRDGQGEWVEDKGRGAAPG